MHVNCRLELICGMDEDGTNRAKSAVENAKMSPFTRDSVVMRGEMSVMGGFSPFRNSVFPARRLRDQGLRFRLRVNRYISYIGVPIFAQIARAGMAAQ